MACPAMWIAAIVDSARLASLVSANGLGDVCPAHMRRNDNWAGSVGGCSFPATSQLPIATASSSPSHYRIIHHSKLRAPIYDFLLSSPICTLFADPCPLLSILCSPFFTGAACNTQPSRW